MLDSSCEWWKKKHEEKKIEKLNVCSGRKVKGREEDGRIGYL